jgi:hypothetical protein
MNDSWWISAPGIACGNWRCSGQRRVAKIVRIAILICWWTFLPDAEIGLLDYAGLSIDLTTLIGREVDLVSKNGLKPRIRASVMRDARSVYAA